MVIFAFYNLKGGVGKTTATINLAYLAAISGYRTLVWDLDPQGSASYYLSATTQIKKESKKLIKNVLDLSEAVQPSAYENLFIIPADLSARNADLLLSEMKQSKKKFATLLSSVKKHFDLVILDCPPGISLIHDNIFHAADWLLIPNIPTTLSIRSFETVINYFKDNNLKTDKINGFFNMVDHRKNLHHETMTAYHKDHRFLKSYIPYLSDVEKMGLHQAPLPTYAGSSYAAQCYLDLWKEINKACL